VFGSPGRSLQQAFLFLFQFNLNGVNPRNILFLPFYTSRFTKMSGSCLKVLIFLHNFLQKYHNELHGAEPFSRSRQLCSYSRTSQYFMEPEGSLPYSQESSTRHGLSSDCGWRKRPPGIEGNCEYINKQVDFIGFWRGCITHRIKGFSDFVHRPDSK
jgi:hypothetical protein